MDPVRYQAAGGKDFIAMLGADLRGYDVPHQLVEQLYRDTGVRTNPLRGISFLPTGSRPRRSSTRSHANRARTRSRTISSPGKARRAPSRWSNGWRRWRIGARNATAAERSGFAYLDYSGSQVAGIAEISLNRTSGEIKVHNFWCTIDCGVAVQPDNVIAQQESSIVYGLGVTLTELITVKNGVVEQSNFYDYHVPRMNGTYHRCTLR